MAQSNKSAPDVAQPLGLTETLRRTKVGETIYLAAESPAVSACAASAGIKVTTARLLAIHPGTRAVTDITAVTIVSREADGPSSTPASRAPASRTSARVRRAA